MARFCLSSSSSIRALLSLLFSANRPTGRTRRHSCPRPAIGGWVVFYPGKAQVRAYGHHTWVDSIPGVSVGIRSFASHLSFRRVCSTALTWQLLYLIHASRFRDFKIVARKHHAATILTAYPIGRKTLAISAGLRLVFQPVPPVVQSRALRLVHKKLAKRRPRLPKDIMAAAR